MCDLVTIELGMERECYHPVWRWPTRLVDTCMYYYSFHPPFTDSKNNHWRYPRPDWSWISQPISEHTAALVSTKWVNGNADWLRIENFSGCAHVWLRGACSSLQLIRYCSRWPIDFLFRCKNILKCQRRRRVRQLGRFDACGVVPIIMQPSLQGSIKCCTSSVCSSRTFDSLEIGEP